MTKNYDPKVTIMIPTYNQADFIIQALNSALSQTYHNLEVIVGDDGSTDDTESLLNNIKDPRFRHVRNISNIGRVANYKNLLTKYATGDYVINLDGDDYYTDPEFISEAVALLSEDQNVVMVVAKVNTVAPHRSHVSELPDTDISTGLDILRHLPDTDYHLMHMGVLYHRKIAIDTDFYRSSTISSDWESLYRLALRGVVKYLDREVGVWRIHGLNETENVNSKNIFNNLSIWPSIYAEAVAFGMSELFAKYYCAKCVAFFSILGCIRVSMIGNGVLIGFVFCIIKSYRLASVMLFLTPSYVIRLFLCVFGHYRRKRVL